jgi:ubiquitin-like-conjugating enzyme ATG3
MSGLLNDIKNKALNAALGLADSFTPVLKESKFRETGFLTPDEFVVAGDFLVHHCPTWQWASGDKLKIKDYLPKEKQFLLTKNVPCSKRCKHLMDLKNNVEKVVEEETGDGGWVDTHFADDAINRDSIVHEIDGSAVGSKPSSTYSRNNVAAEIDNDDDEDEDDEPIDMVFDRIFTAR